jgi:hypothetical protein
VCATLLVGGLLAAPGLGLGAVLLMLLAWPLHRSLGRVRPA